MFDAADYEMPEAPRQISVAEAMDAARKLRSEAAHGLLARLFGWR